VTGKEGLVIGKPISAKRTASVLAWLAEKAAHVRSTNDRRE